MSSATVINFKDLFIKALAPHVSKNLTKSEANELYLKIKKYANLETVKQIIIDDSANTHYFFAKHI